MSFTIASSKLTGNPGESGWAQVHEFKPKDEEKLSLRGHLFAVIATKGSRQAFPAGRQDLESVVVGRELLARFHEEYFGNISASAFNALKDACEKVISEFSENLGSVQIAAVSILEDRPGKETSVVYSAAGGGAQVAIFREGMLAKILESRQKEPGGKLEVVSASGYPEEEDLLILGTSSFFDTFAAGSLKAALERKDPEATVELLAPTVHATNGKEDLGAAFLKFEKGKELVEERITPDTSLESTGPEKDKKVLKKVFSSLRSKYSRLEGDIKKRLASRLSRLPEKRIYVKEGAVEIEAVHNRRLAVSIGIILLTLLIVSIGFGIRQKNIKEERGRYEPKLDRAKHEFEEAVSLFPLDAGRARELFAESKKIVDQLMSEGIDDPELLDLSENLNQNKGKILGEYTPEAELFVDLSLLSDGFKGDDLAASGGKIFVFDKSGKKIIRISIDTKRSEVVAGPDKIEGGESITVYSDRVFVLDQSNIDEVGKEKKRVIEGDWQGEAMSYAYAGNLYVLDKKGSIIWRYPGITDGFASGTNWFSEGVAPDLTKIISWTIDGSIWLLSDSGKIFQYSSGNQVNFVISGLTQGLINPKSIYSNEEQKFLYVLDPDETRVVVLAKTGEYKAQYRSEKIREANELAVSEAEGKIVLLAGDKLYSIEIKHLIEQ